MALRDLGLKRREESIIVGRKLALRGRKREEVIDEGPQRTAGLFLQFLPVGVQFGVIERERSAIVERVAVLQQRSRQQHQANTKQVHLIHIDPIGCFRREYGGYFLRRCVGDSIPMKASSYLDILIFSAFSTSSGEEKTVNTLTRLAPIKTLLVCRLPRKDPSL